MQRWSAWAKIKATAAVIGVLPVPGDQNVISASKVDDVIAAPVKDNIVAFKPGS